MAKAADAFRTISEVSDILDTPAHVLRFWESKFTQVKPVKRAGGRRYYRPDDISLLAGIKSVLHDQGMTIKGAQKLLREKGLKHVVQIGEDRLATLKAPTDEAAAPEMPKVVVAETQADAPAPPPLSIPSSDVPASPVVPETKVVEIATAMPPPSAVESDPVPAPAATQVMQEPLLPREAATPPEPRIFAALRDAKPAYVRQNAAQIAPLVQQLEAVRDRIRAGLAGS